VRALPLCALFGVAVAGFISKSLNEFDSLAIRGLEAGSQVGFPKIEEYGYGEGQVYSTLADAFRINGFGEAMPQEGQVRYNARLTFALATALDPWYKEHFESVCPLMSVIWKLPADSARVAEYGLRFQRELLETMSPEFLSRYWRVRFYLPFYTAVIYLYDLGNLPQAMKWFKYSGEQKDAPPYIKELSGKLQREGGVYEVGVNIMGNLARAERRNGREELALGYEKKRHDLIVLQHLFHTRKGFQSFLASDSRWKSAVTISRADQERAWQKFVKREPYVTRDPFGGVVSLGKDGDVVTTTPHDRVMGLGKEGVQ
jgi:hypothetical protein